jgi:hypothetical protein
MLQRIFLGGTVFHDSLEMLELRAQYRAAGRDKLKRVSDIANQLQSLVKGRAPEESASSDPSRYRSDTAVDAILQQAEQALSDLNSNRKTIEELEQQLVAAKGAQMMWRLAIAVGAVIAIIAVLSNLSG